jgi:hypothetical protein
MNGSKRAGEREEIAAQTTGRTRLNIRMLITPDGRSQFEDSNDTWQTVERMYLIHGCGNYVERKGSRKLGTGVLISATLEVRRINIAKDWSVIVKELGVWSRHSEKSFPLYLRSPPPAGPSILTCKTTSMSQPDLHLLP